MNSDTLIQLAAIFGGIFLFEPAIVTILSLCAKRSQ